MLAAEAAAAADRFLVHMYLKECHSNSPTAHVHGILNGCQAHASMVLSQLRCIATSGLHPATCHRLHLRDCGQGHPYAAECVRFTQHESWACCQRLTVSPRGDWLALLCKSQCGIHFAARSTSFTPVLQPWFQASDWCSIDHESASKHCAWLAVRRLF